MRALYVCLDSEYMSDLVTLRIVWDLESRINTLSVLLWECECCSEEDRLIESFGGSPRVDDQHKSRGSR